MQSVPLIVTPLWTSIYKPMNSLEVSRNAGFCTDLQMYANKFRGGPPDPPPPFPIQHRQIK